MPTALFWIGIVVTIFMGFYSMFRSEEDKGGVVALPFVLFLAAAVAKYLGI